MKQKQLAYLLIISITVTIVGSILKIMLLPGATFCLAVGVISLILVIVLLIFRMARSSS